MLVAPPMKDKVPPLSHCCLHLISRQYPLANTCKRKIQRTYHGLGTPGCYQLQFKVKTIPKREIFVERNGTSVTIGFKSHMSVLAFQFIFYQTKD